MTKLKKFTHDESFTPKNVALHSVACQSFCEWVLAVERFARVYRVVQPKQVVYQDVRGKLELVKEKLHQKERHLSEVYSCSNLARIYIHIHICVLLCAES